MKNIQTGFLKILTLFAVIFFSHITQAQIFTKQLAFADSLFKQKRYTQSLEIYEQVLAARQYSPSILLKMAFINEGLGKVSPSLYYLNLYYQATGDEHALLKMQELAAKNRLEGYENIQYDQLYYYVNKYGYQVSALLAAVAIFFLTLIYSQKRKGKTPTGAVVMLLIVLIVLAVQVNFPIKNAEVLITDNTTYLMSGPSAGANVIAVINEGHKLKLLSKKDVWVKVEWLNKPVYVKENRIKPITI
jgi:hypothetical protein